MTNKKSHILIGGDGRSGTTFLMKIFTYLGLNTGFDKDSIDLFIDNRSNAGLEIRLFEKNLPEIIKSPDLYLDLSSENLKDKEILAVIIPIRSFKDIINSRLIISTTAWFEGDDRGIVRGGIMPDSKFNNQEFNILKAFRELVYKCVVNNLPIIFLDFSRLIQDPQYLYSELSQIFNLKNISKNNFLNAFNAANFKIHEAVKVDKLKLTLSNALKLSYSSIDVFQPIINVHLFVNPDIALENKSKLLAWISEIRKKSVNILLCVDVSEDEFDGPEIFVSVGGNDSDFLNLMDMPLIQRKRWLHVDKLDRLDELKLNNLMHCWLSATNNDLVINGLSSIQLFSEIDDLCCEISIFTCAFKNESGLKRAYSSLCCQTIDNWEWVIVDDSGDNGATVEWLRKIDDKRVRIIDNSLNIGYIGTVKGLAVSNCNSDIFLELDHDDVLMPRALECVVNAFKNNPEIGFLFADAAEVNLTDGSSHIYNTEASFGYRFYYTQTSGFTHFPIISTQRTPPIIESNFSHLVGLPNHPRVWARWAYEKAGGYRKKLLVGDDYDLMIRTIGVTKFMRLQEFLYIQYRNPNSTNTTFSRNKQIQDIVYSLNTHYSSTIRNIFINESNLKLSKYSDIITDNSDSRNELCREVVAGSINFENSILFCISETGANSDFVIENIRSYLKKIDSILDKTKIVITSTFSIQGLEDFAHEFEPGKVIWWIDENLRTYSMLISYGKIIATGTIKNTFTL